MAYPANCHVDDSCNNTDLPKLSQQRNAERLKLKKNTAFGDRLIGAFGGAQKSEIASKLEVSPSTLTDLTTKRVKLLPLDLLLKIAETSNCNLHWLITGEGEPGGVLEVLAEPLKKVINQVAGIYGRDSDLVINDLINEAVVARWSLLTSRFHQLQEDQLAELGAIDRALRAESSALTGPAVRRVK